MMQCFVDQESMLLLSRYQICVIWTPLQCQTKPLGLQKQRLDGHNHHQTQRQRVLHARITLEQPGPDFAGACFDVHGHPTRVNALRKSSLLSDLHGWH